MIPDFSDSIVFCSGLRSAENRVALFSALPGNLKPEGGSTAYDTAAFPQSQTQPSDHCETKYKALQTQYLAQITQRTENFVLIFSNISGEKKSTIFHGHLIYS